MPSLQGVNRSSPPYFFYYKLNLSINIAFIGNKRKIWYIKNNKIILRKGGTQWLFGEIKEKLGFITIELDWKLIIFSQQKKEFILFFSAEGKDKKITGVFYAPAFFALVYVIIYLY